MMQWQSSGQSCISPSMAFLLVLYAEDYSTAWDEAKMCRGRASSAAAVRIFLISGRRPIWFTRSRPHQLAKSAIPDLGCGETRNERAGQENRSAVFGIAQELANTARESFLRL